MMKSNRKPYHPPMSGQIHRPLTEEIGYIYGSAGNVGGFGNKDFYISAIPYRLAADLIIKNHYSKRIVNNSYVHVGVYIDGDLKGVLQFGYALNVKFVSKIVENTNVGEYLELNRMWLDDSAPKNSESKAISYSIKYIKRACKDVKWIQSFADERCGRLGVVYQAANFLFLGSHVTTFYEVDGQFFHPMLLTAHKKMGQRGLYLRENISRAVSLKLRQYRYIFFVKPGARKFLKMRVQQYPKHYPSGGNALSD